jgi:hypothetical protein
MCSCAAKVVIRQPGLLQSCLQTSGPPESTAALCLCPTDQAGCCCCCCCSSWVGLAALRCCAASSGMAWSPLAPCSAAAAPCCQGAHLPALCAACAWPSDVGLYCDPGLPGTGQLGSWRPRRTGLDCRASCSVGTCDRSDGWMGPSFGLSGGQAERMVERPTLAPACPAQAPGAGLRQPLTCAPPDGPPNDEREGRPRGVVVQLGERL